MLKKVGSKKKVLDFFVFTILQFVIKLSTCPKQSQIKILIIKWRWRPHPLLLSRLLCLSRLLTQCNLGQRSQCQGVFSVVEISVSVISGDTAKHCELRWQANTYQVTLGLPFPWWSPAFHIFVKEKVVMWEASITVMEGGVAAGL